MPTNITRNKTTAALLAVLACAGCTTGIIRAAKGPKPPMTWKKATLQYNYTTPHQTKGPPYFRDAYTAAADKKLVRNEIIDELVGIVDRNYQDYEIALRSSRNTMDLSATLAAMGTSAAGAVVGGEETKTILAAISTGILGADAAINKTIFRELATEAIQSEMRKLRAELEANIVMGKGKDVDDYTLNQALNDITAYYNAGWVNSALVSLAANAAQGANTAITNTQALKNQ